MVRITWSGRGWVALAWCFGWPLLGALLSAILGVPRSGRLAIGIHLCIGAAVTLFLAKGLDRPGEPPATALGAPPRVLALLVIVLGVIFALASFLVAPEEG